MVERKPLDYVAIARRNVREANAAAESAVKYDAAREAPEPMEPYPEITAAPFIALVYALAGFGVGFGLAWMILS